MRRAAVMVAGLTGWRRSLAAVISGAASVLALAPFYLWYILFITVPVLVWLIDSCCASEKAAVVRMRRSAVVGWWFGFGYLVAGLFWVGNSFLVEAETFAWLMPFAVFGLPAFLALDIAAGVAAAGLVWRPGLPRIIALVLAVGLAELARGHFFTGLPWNTLGYALTGNEAMMQWASLFGVYGLTFLAVAIFAAPAALLEPYAERSGSRLAGTFYVLLMLCLLGGGWALGQMRLEGADIGVAPGVRLRIVQPNIPQTEKWKPDNKAAIFRTYLEVSRAGPAAVPEGLDGITHLIWPESALPFLLADTPEALSAIDDLLPENTTLITGQARALEKAPPDGRPTKMRVYNSLFVMDGEARIVAHYDKLHLVPFGEYLPFQGLLETIGLEQLTRVRGGFTPGTGRRYMAAAAPPFIPLICYEILFPHAIRPAGTQPRWLLNVTNDAWFGASVGPYQHFHQARVRAVEQGLPLVRAANTGISAVVDAYGRIVGVLALGARDALDAPLPAAAPETVFVRFGYLIEACLAALFSAVWLLLVYGGQRR